MLCVQQSRFEEAEQALKQALKLGLEDAVTLASIGEQYVAAGKWSDAEPCLRRAVGSTETVRLARLEAHLTVHRAAASREGREWRAANW